MPVYGPEVVGAAIAVVFAVVVAAVVAAVGLHPGFGPDGDGVAAVVVVPEIEVAGCDSDSD